MKGFKYKAVGYYALSFLIPMVVIIAALTGLKITPFGDNTLAISDGNGLYLNYLGYAGRAVKGEEDILFSFTKGLGGNMVGSWAWFLLNPTFILFAFADIANYMQTYTIVSALNFCLCGLTMYILLKTIYGHKTGNLIFSSAYALNGFLVANVFQMNFFACIPVLPLMMLGLRRILSDRHPLIYILSLAYSLLMNFYFGFMLCAASLLIFIVFFIADRDQIAGRKFVAVKYILSSLFAGALSSVVWLPALLSLRGGRLDQSLVGFITMRENMPFLDMFAKLFTGANTTAELSNGLPNIFVGILPVFLVILFFTNSKIIKQRKTAAAVLLIGYLISFYIVVFNIAMHGGTTTNWFNYRDSFVFCFLMLMIAAEEWQHITEEPGKNIKKAFLILLVVSLIVFSKSYEFVTGTAVLIDYAILAFMYLAYRMHLQDAVKNTKRAFTWIVLILMCVNLFLNYFISTKNILVWAKPESGYQNTVVPVSALVDAVKKSDADFYRMEVGEQRSGRCGNDPMLYGYYGVGHGGSDDRDFVRAQLSKLGVRRYNMRNSYGQGVPAATDIFLGLRYIISRDDLTEEKGYERLVTLGEWSLYQNPHALPIAMAVNTDVSGVELDLTDVFDNLNRTWSAMTGIDDMIFTEENDITFTSKNITDPRTMTQKEAVGMISANRVTDAVSDSMESIGADDASTDSSASKASSMDADFVERGTTREKESVNSNYIMFTWTASQDGQVYTYNGSAMTEDNGSSIPALNYEGYYHKGDIVTGYITTGSGMVTKYLLEDVAAKFKAAYVSTEVLTEMSKTILARHSIVERVKDSYLRGEVTLEAGQELMFTIPYDEGWTLIVDGQETEVKKNLGVFMAAEVGPGTHTYEMKFLPAGLNMGAVAAAASLVLIIAFVLIDSRKRRTEKPAYPQEQSA